MNWNVISAAVTAALLLYASPARTQSYTRLDSGCGVTQSCAAVSYEATRTDGEPAFVATAVGCFADLGPGVNNTVCTNGSNGGEILLGDESGNPTAIVRASQFFASQFHSTNGAINCDGACEIRDSANGSLPINTTGGVVLNSTTAMTGFLLVPVTIDIPAITGSCDSVTATVAGVEANDAVFVTPDFDMTVDVTVGNARVTNAATDEVTFLACGDGLDPASGSYLFWVVRKA